MFPFQGQHYLSSFLECDKQALCNITLLRTTAIQAIKESGATLLQEVSHAFSEDACTMVFLLSESHCSFHTYPEYGSVFIDLFTCGDKCHYKEFESIMLDYLQPKKVVRNVVYRGEQHVIT